MHPPGNVESDRRPICLTPTLYLLFESHVGNWILNRVAFKQQFGVLGGRSTTHALLHMSHKDRPQSARMMFVDFSTAFDRVDHERSTCFGISGSVVKGFASFLTNRQKRVKVVNYFSSWFILNGGIPQGSWLGLSCPTVNVDDRTITEILYVSELHHWLIICRLLNV